LDTQSDTVRFQVYSGGTLLGEAPAVISAGGQGVLHLEPRKPIVTTDSPDVTFYAKPPGEVGQVSYHWAITSGTWSGDFKGALKDAHSHSGQEFDTPDSSVQFKGDLAQADLNDRLTVTVTMYNLPEGGQGDPTLAGEDSVDVWVDFPCVGLDALVFGPATSGGSISIDKQCYRPGETVVVTVSDPDGRTVFCSGADPNQIRVDGVLTPAKGEIYYDGQLSQGDQYVGDIPEPKPHPSMGTDVALEQGNHTVTFVIKEDALEVFPRLVPRCHYYFTTGGGETLIAGCWVILSGKPEGPLGNTRTAGALIPFNVAECATCGQ
jgi:hypothetical protein